MIKKYYVVLVYQLHGQIVMDWLAFIVFIAIFGALEALCN